MSRRQSLHALLRALEEAAIGLRPEERQQGREGGATVAHQADLHRVAKADAHGVELDLDRPRLSRLRQELDVRERRADHQEGIAPLHRLLRRPRAEQADAAGRVRAVVGHRGLAEQGLHDRRGEAVGDRLELVPRVERAPPGQDGDPAPRVQQLGGPTQPTLVGQARAAAEGVRRVVLHVARRPRCARLHLLDIDREREVGDPAIGERGPAGQVGDVLDVRRSHDALVELGHVHEEAVEGHVLLGVGADEIVIGHAGDGEHRLTVERGVVEPVQEVDAPGAGRGQAHPEAAGELRVAARHERGRFLVAHLYEPDPVLPGAQRLHDPVDAVAGQAEHDVDSPAQQRLDQDIRRGHRHGRSPPARRGEHRTCQPVDRREAAIQSPFPSAGGEEHGKLYPVDRAQSRSRSRAKDTS